MEGSRPILLHFNDLSRCILCDSHDVLSTGSLPGWVGLFDKFAGLVELRCDTGQASVDLHFGQINAFLKAFHE